MNYGKNTFFIPLDVDETLLNLNLSSHTGLMVAALMYKIVWISTYDNSENRKSIEGLCNESDQLTKDWE